MRIKSYSMYQLPAAAVVIALLPVRLIAQTSGFACSGLEETTSEAALAYLQQDRSTLQAGCIDHAIEILRQSQPKSAVKVLLRYLDFEKPHQSGVPHSVRLGPTNGVYPAADAVAEFGVSIIPELKKTIASDSSTSVERVSAAKVYFWLINDPSTIAFIAQAAKDAVDLPAGKDLRRIAETMVHYCPTEERDACQKALAGR